MSAQARKPRATKEQMRINPPQTISIRVGGGLYQWLVDWEELCRGTDKNTKISRSHLCTLMMKSVQGKLDKAKEAGPKARKLDSVHLERIMSLVDRAAEERAMKGAVGGKEEEETFTDAETRAATESVLRRNRMLEDKLEQQACEIRAGRQQLAQNEERTRKHEEEMEGLKSIIGSCAPETLQSIASAIEADPKTTKRTFHRDENEVVGSATK